MYKNSAVVLPAYVRSQLMIAAGVEPKVSAGESSIRTLLIDGIIRKAKKNHPNAFTY